MNLKNKNMVYLLGIGGIGMSALAQYFLMLGKVVAGYDRTGSAITEMLLEKGVQVSFSDEVSGIPDDFRNPGNKDKCLIIYTPAVPAESKQFEYFRGRGYEYYKRAEVLGEISKGFRTIAVGGSHGKTTVSAMVAEIMQMSDHGCSAFLGGISKNLQSNLLLNNNSEWAVMEADEFDRSFLKLYPEMLVVTSMDPDHLDIYGDSGHMQDSFRLFVDRLPENGHAVLKEGLGEIIPAGKQINARFYGLEYGRDYRAENIISNGLCYNFDLVTPGGRLKDMQTGVPGWINIENAVAASAICLEAGVEKNFVISGIKSFKGIKRRFDIRVHNDRLTFIDDYAHHPREIQSFIYSVRKLFPGRSLTGIFQPHLFSRTRDFAREFGIELSKLDELIMLDIYPAREKPIEGVSSNIILKEVSIEKKMICSREDLIPVLDRGEREIIVTMGAGDIDRLVEPLEKHFMQYAT
jgi:UDP-N-acetylmuramate--alanine ligase